MVLHVLASLTKMCPFTISVHRYVMAVDIGQVSHLLWQHEDLIDFSLAIL